MVGGSCLIRRVAFGTLVGALLLPVGACQAVVDHPQDLATLLEWAPVREAKTPAFEAVSDKERGVLPPSEPQPYRLGIGDTVEVRVVVPTNVVGLEGPVVATVKEDGSLNIPVARRIEALDKTTLEVEAALVEHMKDYVNAPLVNVTVTSHNARLARVVGEGAEEEQYMAVDGHLTLLQALIKSGATRKATADREEAYLIRNKLIFPISIAAMVDRGDPSGDVVLEQGDHIVVPSIKARQDFVYVFGQVMKPGRFEMDHGKRPGDRGTLTLTGAVGLAGGLNEQTVDRNGIALFRGGCCNLRVFHLSAHELLQCGESIAMEPGDRVWVAPSGLAQFSQGLQHFMPFLSGIGNITSIILSTEALIQSRK